QVLPEGRLDAPGELHVVRAQLVDELLVVHERDARRHEDAGLLLAAQQLAEPIAGAARGRGQGTRLGDPADLALGDGHFLDLVGLALAVLAALPVEAQTAAQGASRDPAYRAFPVLGSRLAVWAVAQLHLNFAAFILGVPIFAVIIEAIGWRTGDARYDWLSHE